MSLQILIKKSVRVFSLLLPFNGTFITSPLKETVLICSIKRFTRLHAEPKFLPPTKYDDKFLKYAYGLFISNPKYKDSITKLLYEPENINKDKSNTNSSKIISLENDLNTLICDRKEVFNVSEDIRRLDKEFASIHSKMTISETLKILSSFHILMGLDAFNRNMRYFSALLLYWKNELGKTPSSQLIMMLFYVTQAKVNQASNLLKCIEEHKDEISFNEWVVICHCCFRLKIKLPDDLLNTICFSTVKNLDNTESFELISVLKAMRYSQFWQPNLWDKLVDFVCLNAKTMNFAECAHFLATFASVSYYNAIAFKQLEEKGVELLINAKSIDVQNVSELHGSLYPRSKDITRFLWALSHVNYPCSDLSRNHFVDIIDKNKEIFLKNPQYLVDALVSFSTYNTYPDSIISLVFSEKVIFTLLNLGKDKPLHQLYYLNISILIEHPKFYGKLLNKRVLETISGRLNRPLYKELRDREGLSLLIELIMDLFEVTGNEVKCVFLLPHIKLASVVVFVKNGKLCPLPSIFDKTNLDVEDLNVYNDYSLTSFEILDKTVCINGEQKPIGLMEAKMRQLKHLGVTVQSLTSEMVFDFKNNPEILKKIIKC